MTRCDRKVIATSASASASPGTGDSHVKPADVLRDGGPETSCSVGHRLVDRGPCRLAQQCGNAGGRVNRGTRRTELDEGLGTEERRE